MLQCISGGNGGIGKQDAVVVFPLVVGFPLGFFVLNSLRKVPIGPVVMVVRNIPGKDETKFLAFSRLKPCTGS